MTLAGVAQVLHQDVECWQSPCLTMFLLRLLQSAESNKRLTSSFLRRHTDLAVLFNGKLQARAISSSRSLSICAFGNKDRTRLSAC
jgi:hypothetical protein